MYNPHIYGSQEKYDDSNEEIEDWESEYMLYVNKKKEDSNKVDIFLKGE